MDQEGLGEPARQGGKDETIGLPPADNLLLAFEDADLVAQNQQLGLISGAVVEGCEGEVDEEPEAGVQDVEEHGRRLIVAGLGGSPLSSDGLSAPHTQPPCPYAEENERSHGADRCKHLCRLRPSMR